MIAAKRKRSKTTDGHDYLSALPDCLIHHIFSFMPIKDVPKTCILSKRWRSTWVGISDLVFDDSVGPSFVDLVLKQRSVDVGINKLSIKFKDVRDKLDESTVNSWLRYAVGHWVQDLSLKIRHRMFCFPQFLYYCPSIVKLDISCSRMISPIECISWISVTALTIRDAVLSDDLIGEIFKGSPALEFLELQSCRGMNQVEVKSSLRLRELVIDSYKHDFRIPEDYVKVEVFSPFIISVPNLLVLRLRGTWHGKIVKLVEISSVVEAEIDFSMTGMYSFLNPSEGAIAYANIMKEFSRASTVTFGHKCLHYLAYDAKGRMDLSTVEWKNVTLKSSFVRFYREGVVRLLKCLHVEKLVMKFDPTISKHQQSDSLNFPKDEFWGNHSFKCWDKKCRAVEIVFVGSASDRTFSRIKWLLALSKRLCSNRIFKVVRRETNCRKLIRQDKAKIVQSRLHNCNI